MTSHNLKVVSSIFRSGVFVCLSFSFLTMLSRVAYRI